MLDQITCYYFCTSNGKLYDLPLRRSKIKALTKKELFSNGVSIDLNKTAHTGFRIDNSPISNVTVNQLAANNPCEDSWDLGFTQVEGVPLGIEFAVFDGFAGLPCVSLLAWSLLDFTSASLLSHDQLASVRRFWQTYATTIPFHLYRRVKLNYDSSTQKSLPQMPSSKFLANHIRMRLRAYVNDLFLQGEHSTDTKSASNRLTEAFERLDNELCLNIPMANRTPDQFDPLVLDLLQALDSPLDQHKLDGESVPMPFHDLLHAALAGSTTVMGSIRLPTSRGDSDKGKLCLANTGGCRAVLFRKSAADKALQPVLLTKTHSIDDTTDQTELNRLASEHPETPSDLLLRSSPSRNGNSSLLLGELSYSRAFGGVRYKWAPERLSRVTCWPGCLDQLYPSSSMPHPYTSPPYLTARPDVDEIELSPSDRFLVLATDGFWQRARPKDVAKQLQDTDDDEASNLLWNCLNSHNGNDQLLLPPGIARYSRDDITVMVLRLSPPPS